MIYHGGAVGRMGAGRGAGAGEYSRCIRVQRRREGGGAGQDGVRGDGRVVLGGRGVRGGRGGRARLAAQRADYMQHTEANMRGTCVAGRRAAPARAAARARPPVRRPATATSRPTPAALRTHPSHTLRMRTLRRPPRARELDAAPVAAC